MKPTSLPKCLDEILVPLDFRKQGSTWNRIAGEFIDVIEVQRFRANGQVTLNFGVLYPPAYKAFWNKPIPDVIREVDATLRVRAGWLERNRDLWWEQKGEELCFVIRQYINASVLPFLESMHSLDAIVSFLRNPYPLGPLDGAGTIQQAAAEWLNGDIEQARSRLLALKTKFSGGWWDRASETLERLETLSSPR